MKVNEVTARQINGECGIFVNIGCCKYAFECKVINPDNTEETVKFIIGNVADEKSAIQMAQVYTQGGIVEDSIKEIWIIDDTVKNVYIVQGIDPDPDSIPIFKVCGTLKEAEEYKEYIHNEYDIPCVTYEAKEI
jgi:hypothetical protein